MTAGQHKMLEGTAPATPAAGYMALYGKTDHLLYSLDSNAQERLLSGMALGVVPSGDTSGVTDTAAIGAAIDAAAAAGGGVVYLIPGTFWVTGISKSGKDNVTLAGAGFGATTIKLKAAGNAEVIELTSCDYLHVRDLALDGNKANQSAGVYHGIELHTCDHLRMTNVLVKNSQDSGVVLRGCVDAMLHQVYTYACGGTGNVGVGIYVLNTIDTLTNSHDIQISDCLDDGSGLTSGAEGAGLSTSQTTYGVNISNYTSLNALKYGLKLQGYKHNLANIVVYNSANNSLSLQGYQIHGHGIHIDNASVGGVTGIDILYFVNTPTTEWKRVHLSNVEIINNVWRGIEIGNTVASSPLMRDVQIVNAHVYAGAVDSNRGVLVRGYVGDVDLIGVHVYDYNLGFDQATETSGSPTRIRYIGCTAAKVGTYTATAGFQMYYGDAQLIGCQTVNLTAKYILNNNPNIAIIGEQGVAMSLICGDTGPRLQIASGAVAAGTGGVLELEAETGTTDDLTDITGGIPGQVLMLCGYSTHVITVKHNAAKIVCPAGIDYALSVNLRLLLICVSAGLWTAFNT